MLSKYMKIVFRQLIAQALNVLLMPGLTVNFYISAAKPPQTATAAAKDMPPSRRALAPAVTNPVEETTDVVLEATAVVEVARDVV